MPNPHRPLAMREPSTQDIALERVRSGHVVVVLVLQADGEAARLVDLARNSLEAGAHLDIRRRDRAVNRQGKAQIRLVRAELRERLAVHGGLVRYHLPLRRRPAASQADLEGLGNSTLTGVTERDRLRRGD